MKTKTLHKALSMLLTAAMVLNMGLTPVFAEGVAIGASGLTECHTAHDSECGYSETIQMGGCTHEHDGDCGFTEGAEEQPCTFIADEDAEASPADADEHSHDDTCGYAPATEGTPCEHKHDSECGYGETVTVTPCAHTCEVCNVLDSGKPAEKVCTCEPALVESDAGHGENCPFYIAPEQSEAVQALIAMVDALPNGLEITEENKEATIPAFEAAAMAYGELSDEDKAAFEATSQYTKLMALREVLFGLNTLELNYSTNWQGKGTSADPYLITSVEELRGIAYATKNMGQYNSIYLRLTIDIDLENEEWTPISNPSDVRYIGFDGDNHVISNFTVTNPSGGAAGLFGTMKGDIKNLGVSGATITATSGYGGAILGDEGTTNITNCYVVNSTVTGKNVGGIAGVCYTLENCYTGADVEVTGRLSAGGLAYVVTGNVTNCYFAGTVTGGGGKEIFGGNGQTTIKNCYALNTSVSEDMTDYDKIPLENIKTADAFASGEVTYLLNSSNDIIYRQTIDTDSFPTLNSSSGVVYRQGEEGSYTYSNDDTITHTISWTENNEIYTIVPESGYDTTVDDSGSFRFRVKLTDEEAYRPEIYVRANGQNITASGGVYMISQIRENKEITVSASKKTCRIFMQKNLFETFGDNGKWKMRLDADKGYNYNDSPGYFSVPYGESITFKLTVNGNYGWSTDDAKLTYDNQSVNHDEGFPGQFTFSNIKENHTVSAITDVTKKQFAIAFQSAGGYTIEKADTEADLNADQYGSFSFVVTPPAGMESEPYTVKLADPNGKGYVRDGNFIINLDWDISQYIVDINDPDIRYTTNVLKDNGGGKYTIDCVAQNLNVLILPLSFKQNLSSTTKTYSRLGEKDGDTYKTPLTVLASADSETQLADKEVQYDWYRNTKSSAEGATKLNIDKSAYYIPADQAAGTYYYFAEAFYSDSPTIRIQSKIQRVDIVKEIAKLKLDSDKTIYTYGEDITFTTAVSIPTTRVRAVATANTVDFYCGETKLNSAPITLTESNGIGTVDFTYNTAGKGIPTGTQTITAIYGGSDNLKDRTATNNITLNKQQLTATITSGNSKVYDGNPNFLDAVLTLGSGEVLSGDTVSVSANIAAKNADVGENKALVATGITLTGEGADWYSLTSDYITGNLSITPATPSVKVTAVKQEKSLLRSIIGDHNDTIILTATTKGVGSEKPDGQVVFKNGSTILETKTTSNGVATYEWKNPPTGNYTITAEFTASDSNYISTAVTGTADGFEISKGTQDALTVNVPTLTYGDTDKSLTTTGGSGAGAVTYTVTEGDCITVNANTGAITVVKEGDAKVTATKAGDTNFNSITSGETQIKVNLATPTVAWASDTQTLTYTGNPAAITSPTVTGIAAGDTSSGTISYAYKKVDGFTRGLFAGYTDGLPKDAGKYEIKAQIAAAGNYDKADSTNVLKLTVEQKTSTLTINSYTGKTYDGNAVIDPTNITSNVTTPTVNYTYYLADGMTKTTKANSGASGTGKAPVNAGDYKVTGTIEETPNTTAITSAAVSFAISQSPLTINGGTVTSKKYDSTTTATVTALTFVGLQNGEALEIATDYTVGTPMFDTAAVGDGKTVTGTAALVNNGKTNNYSLTGAFVNVKGNITLADGPAAPINGVVDDTKGTDTFTFDSTSGVIYEYKINDGAWTDITASGATTAISVGNIAVPVGELQVRVKKTDTHATGAILSNDTKFTASIEGSVAIAGTATYGETLTATATGTQTGAVLSYEWKTNEGTILQAESASSTYKIAGAAVGSTITVEVTAAGYDGKLDATTAAVAKKNLTVTATAQNKEYDGGIDATVRFTFGTGEVVSGDSVTVTATTKFDTKGVDIDKTVNITDFKLDGAEKDNYTVTTPPTTATASITTKALTVSDGTLVITKEYDTAATFAAGNTTGTLAIESVVGDTVSVKIDSYGVADSANVGTKTISLDISLEGTDKGNYTIASPYSFTKATIKTKTITPTIDAIAAVDYNGTAKEPVLTVKDGSTVLTSGTDYTAVYSDNVNAGVGTGKVKVTLNGNYNGMANATFTINKASGLNATTPNNLLMIKQQKKEYTFDLSTIALDKTDTGARTYALGALANSNDIFETIPSITGNEMRFTSKSIVSPAANQATQVVTISTQNYEDVSVTLSFDITNKTPVTISGLTAATGLVYNGSPQKGYTGTAAFSPTWSGTLTYTYYEGTGTSGTKLSGAPTNTGTYTVVASIPDSDTTYEGSHADITFTIGQKEITVTAGTYTVSKSYDDTTDAGTGTGTLKATGILSVDSGVTVAPGIIPAYSGSAVKSDYEIILPIIISGDTNSNYNLAANTVTVPGKITKATVTATMDAIAAVDYTESQIKPTVTVKVNGNAISDANYTVVYGANINAGTDAGSVTVKAKADGNYSFTDVTANFTINKIAYAGAAITGNKYVVQNKVETGAQFDLASLSFPAGFKDKAFASVAIGTNTDGLITGTPSISGTKVVFDVASIEKDKTGVLNVTVKSTNYNDYTVAITVTTVEKTPVAITGLTAETNLSYSGSPQKGYTGNVAVEGNKVPTNELVYTYTSTDGGSYNDTTPPTNAGDYKLVVSIADSNASYIGSHADILFTIGKKAVTVNADNQTMTKNGTLPTFTVSYTGFVGAENESNAALATAAVAGCAADGTTVGTFEITLTTQAILNATIGKNYNITEQKGGTLTVSEITHGITASAGTGGTISPIGTVTVTDGASQTFTITANSSYSIDSVTVDGASQGAISTYTFSNVTGNHTISATFSYNGGGGGGSTGGGGNSGGSTTPTTPPTITDPTLPENGNVNLKPSVDKDGNATVTVSDNNIDDAIKKAQDEAKKNGTEKNGIAVTITIDTNQTLNSFTANLPKSTQEKLIAAGVTTLTINGGATITFDLEAIKQIKTTANTDVVVTATKTVNSALSQEAQAATGGRPVYDFKVTGGGKNITTFGSGKLSLSIPYELQKVDGNGKPSATGSFENPGNLVGVYIDGAGKLTYLPGSSYNATSKTMLISTTHLSVYGVAYKTNAPTFTDTATHWAKDDIQFVAARGLLTGTTATTFSPNNAMTRGMFVTALGRLAGIDTNSYKTGSFTDVKTDAYYAPYVNWAAQNNIVTGTSATTFAPDNAITRQEMAVMTANYAKAIGYKLPSVHKEIIFTDSASIGAWAKSAVKEMQMAGILMGKDGGKFDPTGTATRAEVSAMLRRFVELVANSETAEGWVTNDSGNWMYFENGKAVTGKKKIDGTTYEFDQYGVTAILPKDRRFTLYTVQKGDSFWAIASKYKVNIFELVSLNGKNIFSTIHPGDELKIPQK